mgnify:CR=1 FL=1
MEGATVATLVGNAGDIVTAALGWVSSTVSTVVSNPLILLFVVLPLVGLGIGLFRRLINVQ